MPYATMLVSRTARLASLVLVLLLASTHTAGAQSPPLEAVTFAPTVQPGDTLTVAVDIGSGAQPIGAFYGAAFQLHFDADVFDVTGYSAGILFEDHLGGLSPDATEFFRLVEPGDDLDEDGQPDGESYVAYAVTMNNPAPAIAQNGEVVQVHLQALADAVPGGYTLGLENVRVSDAGGDDVAVAPRNADVTVSTTRRERRHTFVPPGSTHLFDTLDSLQLAFATLSDTAEVLAGRVLEVPGGTSLPSDTSDGSPYEFVADGYWTLTQSGASSLSVELCLPFRVLTDSLVDRSRLRILKRTAGDQPWEILTTTLEPDDQDPERVCASVSSFSTFVLAAPRSAIPVELTHFDAVADAGGVALAWQTASETNNAGFTIQRAVSSTEGAQRTVSEWREIAFVEGAGTTTETQSYAFTDEGMPFEVEVVQYRLKQVDFDGTATYSEAVEVELAQPEQFTLHGAFPNPFRQATTIRYELPEARRVALEVFDVLGRKVATLVDGKQEAGRKQVRFDTQGLPSGVYVVRLTAEGQTRAQTITVVR